MTTRLTLQHALATLLLLHEKHLLTHRKQLPQKFCAVCLTACPGTALFSAPWTLAELHCVTMHADLDINLTGSTQAHA